MQPIFELARNPDEAAVNASRLHICFLSAMHPLRDKRVFDKEAVALAAAGFTVTHIAPGTDGEESDSGVRLRTYARPAGLLGRIKQMPRLYRLARSVDADVYHCNEVDSWLVGAALKLIRRKPIVFDVHEVYPQEFAESRFPQWLQPLVVQSIRALFKLLMPITDRVVLAKRSVAQDFRGWEHKQTLVQNFTPLRFLTSRHEAAKRGENDHQDSTSVVAIHLGGFSKVKGWPQLVGAMSQPQIRTTGLKVLVLGAFDASYPEFMQELARSGTSDRFEYEEWLPFDQAFQRLLASHIGLVLLQPGRYNHVHALPHKLFDYMMAGLPVIAPAFATEVAAIVREADCGILVDPTNPEDISAAMLRLARDPVERRRLGDNGRRAVLDRYNWEQEAEKLVDMYRALGGQMLSGTATRAV